MAHRTDIDWYDEAFQNCPASLALFGFLRELRLEWSKIAFQFTDPQWTAFRWLCKKGFIDGIERWQYTHSDGGKRDCLYTVRGDYINAKSNNFIINADEPVAHNIEYARLLEGGERWRQRLLEAENTDNYDCIRKMRGLVLDYLNQTEAQNGHSIGAFEPACNRFITTLTPPKAEATENPISNTTPSETKKQQATNMLLAMRNSGEEYTSVQDLVKKTGFKKTTIQDAINNSHVLQGWRARSKNEAGRKTVRLAHENMAIDHSSNPAKIAEEREADKCIKELTGGAELDCKQKQEVNEWLESLPDDEKNSL